MHTVPIIVPMIMHTIHIIMHTVPIIVLMIVPIMH